MVKDWILFICPWKLIINLIFLLTFSIMLLAPMVYTQNDWWYCIRVRFLIPLKSNSFKDALSEAIMCMVKNESTSKRSMTHFRQLYEKKERIEKKYILSFKILSICWHWMLLCERIPRQRQIMFATPGEMFLNYMIGNKTQTFFIWSFL